MEYYIVRYSIVGGEGLAETLWLQEPVLKKNGYIRYRWTPIADRIENQWKSRTMKISFQTKREGLDSFKRLLLQDEWRYRGTDRPALDDLSMTKLPEVSANIILFSL